MSSNNIVGLRFHGGFYTGVISYCQYHLLSKISVYLNIPRIRRVIAISDEVFWKLRVSVDVMVTRKKVLSESSNCIETHIYIVVEVIKVQSSVSFELCIDDEFIKSWLADIMFQSPHATNFSRLPNIQWWRPPVSRDYSGRVQRIC